MSRYFNPSRDDLNPFHWPRSDSSLKPRITLNPSGPEIETISFHFSYRLITSGGKDLNRRSRRLCSRICHILYRVYILFMVWANAGSAILFNYSYIELTLLHSIHCSQYHRFRATSVESTRPCLTSSDVNAPMVRSNSDASLSTDLPF